MSQTGTFKYAIDARPLTQSFEKAQTPAVKPKSFTEMPFVKALSEAAGAFLMAMIVRR